MLSRVGSPLCCERAVVLLRTQAALQKKKKDLATLTELAASASDSIAEKVHLVDIRCSRRSAGSGFYITVDGQMFGPFSRVRYEPRRCCSFLQQCRGVCLGRCHAIRLFCASHVYVFVCVFVCVSSDLGRPCLLQAGIV